MNLRNYFCFIVVSYTSLCPHEELVPGETHTTDMHLSFFKQGTPAAFDNASEDSAFQRFRFRRVLSFCLVICAQSWTCAAYTPSSWSLASEPMSLSATFMTPSVYVAGGLLDCGAPLVSDECAAEITTVEQVTDITTVTVYTFSPSVGTTYDVTTRQPNYVGSWVYYASLVITYAIFYNTTETSTTIYLQSTTSLSSVPIPSIQISSGTETIVRMSTATDYTPSIIRITPTATTRAAIRQRDKSIHYPTNFPTIKRDSVAPKLSPQPFRRSFPRRVPVTKLYKRTYDYNPCDGQLPSQDLVSNSLIDVCHFLGNVQAYFVSLQRDSCSLHAFLVRIYLSTNILILELDVYCGDPFANQLMALGSSVL